MGAPTARDWRGGGQILEWSVLELHQHCALKESVVSPGPVCPENILLEPAVLWVGSALLGVRTLKGWSHSEASWMQLATKGL